MAQQFKIIWTAEARTSFDQANQYLESKSVVGARRFRKDLYAVLDSLSYSPKLGAIYLRRSGEEIRELLVMKYRIFYRLLKNTTIIEISLIHHSSRQEPKRIPRR